MSLLNLEENIIKKLTTDDDPNLWKKVLTIIKEDLEIVSNEYNGKNKIFIKIGSCSHWLRPHQTRWTANGGFAWPSGYGGSRYSRAGIPEFDWSKYYLWYIANKELKFTETIESLGKRKYIYRIAIPTRTVRSHFKTLLKVRRAQAI